MIETNNPKLINFLMKKINLNKEVILSKLDYEELMANFYLDGRYNREYNYSGIYSY